MKDLLLDQLVLTSLVVNISRKKQRGFQRLFVLGKFIHNSSVAHFDFLQASYHYR